jgi:hypothetical protein
VIHSVLRGYSRYSLENLFFTPLQDPEVIRYRQDILRDLEDVGLAEALESGAKTLYDLGEIIDQARKKIFSETGYEKNRLAQGTFLDAADRYCREVRRLFRVISNATIHSEGLREFAIFLQSYLESESFLQLEKDISRLRTLLSKIRYCMFIGDSSIRVRRYDGQKDLSERIITDFAKFSQKPIHRDPRQISEEPYADHVEEAVLNMVAAQNHSALLNWTRSARIIVSFSIPISAVSRGKSLSISRGFHLFVPYDPPAFLFIIPPCS